MQLFVERAISSVDSFELTDANVGFVIDICRQLDGIALAIELAAARLDAYGVRGLLVQMKDRFSLLSNSRRGVPDRVAARGVRRTRNQASDRVVSNDTNTTITATRMRSLRLKLNTDVIQTLLQPISN